jgi:hypothetical protein
MLPAFISKNIYTKTYRPHQKIQILTPLYLFVGTSRNTSNTNLPGYRVQTKATASVWHAVIHAQNSTQKPFLTQNVCKPDADQSYLGV